MLSGPIETYHLWKVQDSIAAPRRAPCAHTCWHLKVASQCFLYNLTGHNNTLQLTPQITHHRLETKRERQWKEKEKTAKGGQWRLSFSQNPLHNKASREIDLLLEDKCIWQAVGDFLEGADSEPSSRALLQNLDGTASRKIVSNLMLIFQLHRIKVYLLLFHFRWIKGNLKRNSSFKTLSLMLSTC